MRDLGEVCGLSSRSMYDGFGSKEQFFDSALVRYYDTVLTPVVELLESGRGLDALGQFVEIISTNSVADGCLFVNTGAERANVPASAIERVEKYRETMIRLFGEKLDQASADGEFHGDVRARSLQMSVTLTGVVSSLTCGASLEDGAVALRGLLSDIRKD